MNIKFRLTLLNFLEFAVWGAYLTSMGTYLAGAEHGHQAAEIQREGKRPSDADSVRARADRLLLL